MKTMTNVITNSNSNNQWHSHHSPVGVTPVTTVTLQQPSVQPRSGVTFAFGAFLASPLEPASDQAVIGVLVLCTSGEKGHDDQGWPVPGPAVWKLLTDSLSTCSSPFTSHTDDSNDDNNNVLYVETPAALLCFYFCPRLESKLSLPNSPPPPLAVFLLCWLHVCPISSEEGGVEGGGRVGRWEKEGGDSRRRRRETWGFRRLWKSPPRFFTPKSTQDSDMVKKHLHLQLTAVHSTCFYRCQNGNHQLPVQHAHTQNVDHVILEPECYDHVTVQNT